MIIIMWYYTTGHIDKRGRSINYDSHKLLLHPVHAFRTCVKRCGATRAATSVKQNTFRQLTALLVAIER